MLQQETSKTDSLTAKPKSEANTEASTEADGPKAIDSKVIREHIVQTLKEKRLRVTPQRFAVYANLLGRTDHPTAEEILSDLNKDAPTSSQATLYSSLQALRDVGLVRDVLLEEGVCRYDANVDLHHHFRCKDCGSIEDIPWEQFQQVSTAELRPGLAVESYEVTVHGLCDRCQS